MSAAAIAFDVLAALADTGDLERETWVDARLLGIPQTLLAERDGVSAAAISLRVRKVDRKLARRLGTAAPEAVAA